MSVEMTRCPRCESACVVHLRVSVGFNQWRCNQCSHQWDFASPEERVLVPNHLSGGKAEQFLEEFLAIKAVIKGEAEKIWNSCSNAQQVISVAANEDKLRVFTEQFDRWRDQLIALQAALIVDHLMPLLARYQISSNEQIWLFQACHEAWSPVSAGYEDWLRVTIRGALYGPMARIPEWVWLIRGAPRDLARLDVSPQEKTSRLFHCIAGTPERDLVVHRKVAIAKAFLARQGSASPTANNGSGKGDNISNISAAAERLFRWEDLDQRLLSAKTNDLAEEMHKRTVEAERKIEFDTAQSGNAAGYLPRLFDFHEQLADEWAERLYAAHCEAWSQQSRSVSAGFIRVIRDRPVAQLIAARKSSVHAGVCLRGTRIGEQPNSGALGEWHRRIDRLAARWNSKLEADAVACEYRAQEHVSKAIALPSSSPRKPGSKKSGRVPRLACDFVGFAGRLWLEATRDSGQAKVSIKQLAQIGSKLDEKGYVPPADYLEGRYAKELKAFNSRNSNSKTGAIQTWSRLVSLADKDHLRGMRRMLSRCAEKQTVP